MRAPARRPQLYGDLVRWALVEADSLALLTRFPAASVDAVVTDPPYAIGFDGQDWDGGTLADPLGFQTFSAQWAGEISRILKPGGHLVAFGSPRTFHRLVAGCEDAGLEIRDQLLWLHGRGVPKSRLLPGGISTTLKPAYEPILLARTPLAYPSAVANIAALGTGGLNIEATRVPRPSGMGYWPSHVLASHDAECGTRACSAQCAVRRLTEAGDSGAEWLSRLFYVGKASHAEREAGLEGLEQHGEPIFSSGKPLSQARANIHPTVKPLGVMRWLVRLIAPPGGLVLDPFAGSGSTGCAAVLENRRFIGIEREAQYMPIAKARLAHWALQARGGRSPLRR